MSRKERTPEPRKGKRLAIYCRKSDLKEETQGKSVEQQLERCLQAAKLQGYEVDEDLIFIDRDGSKGWWHFEDLDGRNPPPFRREFTRLMRAVEAGLVDACMVWRSDRAFRDEIVGPLFLRELRAQGVRFIALNMDYQIHTPKGYERAVTDAIQNRTYSDNIAQDVYRNHEMEAQLGQLYRDPSCLGFRSAGLKTKQAVPVPEELALVRRIFDLYVYGPPGAAPMSANAIASLFMDEGVKVAVGAKGHKAKDPNRVHNGQIAAILKNRAYIAEQTFDGTSYPCAAFLVPGPDGELETVVPRHLFDMAQEMMRTQGQHGKDRRAKLLNGLVVCPDCGRKSYSMSRGFKYERSLYCHHRCGRHRTCWGDSYRTLHVCDLEAWVKEHLADLLIAELMAMSAERAGNAERRELASTEARISDLRNTESRKLAELVGVLDAEQIGAVASEFRRQRDALQKRAGELRMMIQGERRQRDDPYGLKSVEDGKLHGALVRAVRWIAVTKQGVVVLTRCSAYIGARLAPGKKRARGGHRPPRILPPSIDATRECLSWIDDKERFLSGLRRGVGTSHHLPDPDDMLCPEYPELGLVFGLAR